MKRRPLIVNRAGTRRPMARPLATGRPDPRAGGADAEGQSWYRVRNAARGGTADVWIYDEIGYWGVTAQQFIDELNSLDADTIELHLNSPGGEVYDGIAIYNALLAHPAAVNVTVEALAASAASFIAQAGTTVTMAANSEMMIHDAIGLGWDNEDGLRELADRLGVVSNNIAEIYSDRAGGTVASWRKAMKAETWYSAREAVDAGLADRVVKVERRGGEAGETEARWASRRDAISARFRYANRGATVAPDTAMATEPGSQQPDHTPGIVAATSVPVDPPTIAETDPLDVLYPGWNKPLDTGQLHREIGVAAGALPAWNLTPDVFRAAIELVANDAPAPPEPRRPASALTRTVAPPFGEGVNLNDVLREVAG